MTNTLHDLFYARERLRGRCSCEQPISWVVRSCVYVCVCVGPFTVLLSCLCVSYRQIVTRFLSCPKQKSRELTAFGVGPAWAFAGVISPKLLFIRQVLE